jgi:hypothetical protein
MKNILIIGSEGSMGKRYQAILKFLGKNYYCEDIKLSGNLLYELYDGFIICTPTDTHADIIKDIRCWDKPILCDKPIAKSSKEVTAIFDSCPNIDLDIMFQYRESIDNTIRPNTSLYDYYRTGNDGLYWDCMQVIALHQGSHDSLTIRNTSPIWNCFLNGKRLSFADMDFYYINYLKKWIFGNRRTPQNEIINYHKKVEDFISYENGRHSDTSKVNEY